MPNRIDHVPPAPDPRRTQRTESQGTESGNQSESTAPVEDRVEISSAAQQARTEQERLQDAARDIPDIREDRVAQARARIESGELNSEEIRRVIADRLLDQFGI